MDYCKKHKIDIVIRGFRQSTDLQYESYIAQEYKKLNPSIKILLLETSTNVSSTKVKKMIQKSQDVSHLIP
jgi:phosphopantetheine adenylyltransferase